MNIEKSILYVDSSILVVNKPSGLRSIPDGYQPEIKNLQTLLKTKFPTLFTIHRLDKETSGVIVFGLNKTSHRNLNIQFGKREIKKNYHAITHNIPEWENEFLDIPLLIDADRRHRTKVHQAGKNAQTSFNKISTNPQKNLSLIEAIPKTGYTHQIRSHLAYLSLPILGDRLYAFNLSNQQKEFNSTIERIMLHATTIEFVHPETNKRIKFTSEIPFNLDEI